jgi:hypothetical protein
VRMHILIPLCLALVLPPAAIITAGPSLAAARTCWKVLDAADDEDDGPEMETLCIDANLKGSFGGSASYFGDVSKCGTVALGGAAKMTFTVNLSACDGDLPNHTIACQPMQAGQARCVLSWTDGSEDRPVLLVPTSD